MDGDARADSDTQLVIGDELRFKGAATRARDHGQAKDTTPEACTICLEPITERAVAVQCNHLTFDFLCLASWLQERATCPLCKATVSEVQYDWRSPDDFKTYRVPQPELVKANSQSSGLADDRRRRGDRRQVERRTPIAEQARLAREDPALDQRRHVYRNRLYSLHVGANRISQHHDFTPESFTASPALQSRARAFLRRELQVFSFLDTAAAPRGGNRNYLVEYVVFVLKTNESKGANGHAEELLADFLEKENARLLLHELEAWLRSPYARLADWDRNVQYLDADRVAKSDDG
ncbi:hypothetical protein LTR36_007709 [Oleoguttula mirabilis]|uniref:RING-type E3 ubiquitin transferase n=1 Tax=Oleoguttula mirabilis TaxID=1507867 RepID=A0AAV9JUL3_9PEZI|nr:hypothetical protein LTR36_007709 [Oleoguttula mirabilis]